MLSLVTTDPILPRLFVSCLVAVRVRRVDRFCKNMFPFTFLNGYKLLTLKFISGKGKSTCLVVKSSLILKLTPRLKGVPAKVLEYEMLELSFAELLLKVEVVEFVGMPPTM